MIIRAKKLKILAIKMRKMMNETMKMSKHEKNDDCENKNEQVGDK